MAATEEEAVTEEEAAPTLLAGPLEPLAPHLSDESDRALAAAAYAELLAERCGHARGCSATRPERSRLVRCSERAARFLADSEARLGAEDAAEEQRAPLGWCARGRRRSKAGERAEPAAGRCTSS